LTDEDSLKNSAIVNNNRFGTKDIEVKEGLNLIFNVFTA